MQPRQSIIRRVLFCCIIGILTAVPLQAWAGWYYTESTTYLGKQQKVLSREKAKTYWQGMKLRKENSDGTIEILRLDQDLYWEYDMASRTYRQLTLVPVAVGAGNLPRELDEALAQLSPEERQLLEKYLPSRPGSQQADAVKVVTAAETQLVSGFPCQKVQARYGNLHTTLWVTNQIALTPEDQAFYRELAKRTLHREGMEDLYLWSEVLSQIGGFAMKQENLLESAAGTVKSVILVDKLVEEPLSDGLFQLPRGLSLQDE
jgi:hypothetical protein